MSPLSVTMILGIRTSEIWVSDLERSRRFYTEILGMETRREDKDNRWVEMGVREAWGKITLRGECGDPKEIRGRGSETVLIVDNIYRFYDKVRKKGVEFIEVPHRLDWGGVVATLLDPDDNEIMLLDQHIISEWLMGA